MNTTAAAFVAGFPLALTAVALHGLRLAANLVHRQVRLDVALTSTLFASLLATHATFSAVALGHNASRTGAEPPEGAESPVPGLVGVTSSSGSAKTNPGVLGRMPTALLGQVKNLDPSVGSAPDTQEQGLARVLADSDSVPEPGIGAAPRGSRPARALTSTSARRHLAGAGAGKTGPAHPLVVRPLPGVGHGRGVDEPLASHPFSAPRAVLPSMGVPWPRCPERPAAQ